MSPKNNNWRLGISFITSDSESAFPFKDGNCFERSFEKAVEAEGTKIPFTVPSISNRVPSLSSSNLQLPLAHGMKANAILSRATWMATQHDLGQKPPGAAESSLEALCHSAVPSARDHATGITIDSIATMPSYDHSYHSMIPMGGYHHSLPTGSFSGKESLERRSRSQERNRLAAMKSRQRKKKEWERLINSESLLREENTQLKQEVARLREQLNPTNCDGNHTSIASKQ